jgi:hypothetical protein
MLHNIRREANLSCSMLDLLRGVQIGAQHIQMTDPVGVISITLRLPPSLHGRIHQ